MGHEVFSHDSYVAAKRSYNIGSSNVTRQAEARTRETGRPSEIVDPSINPIRRSLIRLDPENGRFRVTVGCPIDVTVDCDTTGSMGGEVDTEMTVLPDLYDQVAKVLPGMDPQLCLGIFGDCVDRIVYCRPQFEMTASKIVEYLKEMSPQKGGGGNGGEDPQYAMFARAYLTDSYINRIGLKGYYFIVTDEPMHHSLERSEIVRIFGEDIWDHLKKNGYPGLEDELPNVDEVIRKLKEQTHVFALVLSDSWHSDEALRDWRENFGYDRAISIPSTRFLPQIISAIIGLTEGVVSLNQVDGMLSETELTASDQRELVSGLSSVKIGEQTKLKHGLDRPLPKMGDFFNKKSDLWPAEDAKDSAVTEESGMDWRL